MPRMQKKVTREPSLEPSEDDESGDDVDWTPEELEAYTGPVSCSRVVCW